MADVGIVFKDFNFDHTWRDNVVHDYPTSFETGTTASITIKIATGYRVVWDSTWNEWVEPEFFYSSYDPSCGVTGVSVSINGSGTEITLGFNVNSLYGQLVDVTPDSERVCYAALAVEPIPIPAPDGSLFCVWLPDGDDLSDINDAVFINPTETDPVLTIVDNFFSLRKWFTTFTAYDSAIFRAGKYNYPNITMDFLVDYMCTVDCGSISVAEEFEDFRDYAPYVKAQVYIPFCGFVSVDVNKIMGNDLTLVYQIDVLSGNSLAQLSCEYDNVNIIIGQASGKMAIDLPIRASAVDSDTKGTYAIYSNQMLGDKTPYLLLTYNDTVGSEGYEGYDSSELITVGNVSGFVKYREIHVSGINCTSKEIDEIERLLMSGVIV